MNPHDRTDILFDGAKALGLDNPLTDDGAPTRKMVAEAISDAENDAVPQVPNSPSVDYLLNMALIWMDKANEYHPTRLQDMSRMAEAAGFIRQNWEFAGEFTDFKAELEKLRKEKTKLEFELQFLHEDEAGEDI